MDNDVIIIIIKFCNVSPVGVSGAPCGLFDYLAAESHGPGSRRQERGTDQLLAGGLNPGVC